MNYVSILVGAYLSGALGYIGHIYCINWQWWAIFVPTILLSSWAENIAKDKR